jgi:alkaline phosphatase D
VSVVASEIFAHGVASFDPTATGVLLWTRAAPGTRLGWVVTRAADAGVVSSGTTVATAQSDGCVFVEVDDLEPDTIYHYWFECGGRRSATGRTKTLPGEGDTGLRIGLTSCADFSQGPFSVYRALAESDVDVVLHVGDYIYEDAGKDDYREMDPHRDCVSLDDYRRRYAQARNDADLRALHLQHPMIFVWDDHDVADNAWSDGAKGHDPDVHGPWKARLAAATQARQEWVPSRLADADEPKRMWRSFTVGDLAELVILDTRVWGRDKPCDQPGSKAIDDPERTLLGGDQRSWAFGRIRDTGASWCVVVSQVTVNPLRLDLPGEVLSLPGRAPSGYAVIDGEGLCIDEWDGYPAERARLTAALADRGGRSIILSGDVHSAWAFEGPLDDEGRPWSAEFTCTSISSSTLGQHLPVPLPGVLDHALDTAAADVSHEAIWSDVTAHGYLVIDLDHRRCRAHFFDVDITSPTARSRPSASFEVEAAEGPVRCRPTTDDVGMGRPPERAVTLPPRPERATRAAADQKDAVRRKLVLAGALAAAAGAVWLTRRLGAGSWRAETAWLKRLQRRRCARP